MRVPFFFFQPVPVLFEKKRNEIGKKIGREDQAKKKKRVGRRLFRVRDYQLAHSSLSRKPLTLVHHIRSIFSI